MGHRRTGWPRARGSTRAALKTCHAMSHYPGAWPKAMRGVGLLRILVSRTVNFVARGQPLSPAKPAIHRAHGCSVAPRLPVVTLEMAVAKWIPAFAGTTDGNSCAAPEKNLEQLRGASTYRLQRHAHSRGESAVCKYQNPVISSYADCLNAYVPNPTGCLHRKFC